MVSLFRHRRMLQQFDRNEMNSETIGFDFDQTLADSKSGISSCLVALCQEFNHEIKLSRIEELAISGLTLESMLKELFKQEEIESHKKKFMKLYPSLGIAGTRLIPGAKELVNHLTDHGHRLILISAKGQKNLDLSVEHLGLKFDGVFGGARGGGKTKIMIENRTYLYIGDQLSDVSAANSANAQAVLVSKKSLEIDIDIFPHIQFESLEDLRKSISSLIKI